MALTHSVKNEPTFPGNNVVSSFRTNAGSSVSDRARDGLRNATRCIHARHVSLSRAWLPVTISLLLSACGGGSNGSSADPTALPVDSIATTSSASLTTDTDMTTIGTVVVEERGGRRLFDSWFSQTPTADLEGPADDVFIAEDACNVSDTSREIDALAEVAPEIGAATDWESIGDSVKIRSQQGEVTALLRNSVGSTTVYAQEERWQSSALPDDSMLIFEEITSLAHMDAVPVQPLMPLVWLEPANGILTGVEDSLQWVASFDEQVRIKLRFSGTDFRDLDNPIIVNVECDVVDDGFFTLPAMWQRSFPTAYSSVVVSAVRERVQQVNGNGTNLTLKQISYPDTP